jgi:CRISPR system Cascade subunit CasA
MTQALDSPVFNLIEEPWIPCIRNDGKQVELNLREVLLEAHQLSGLYGETPLIVASLFRFLLAMMYSVYGLPSTRSWPRLWQAEKNNKARVEEYLAKWHERFYLFHPEHPFYQWADGANREKTIVDMFPELSSGNAGTLFDHHTHQNTPVFTPAQAIRALLFVQTFSIAGGNGLAPRDSSDAPWARGVVFFAEGDTLFETLMLNFMSPEQAQLSQKESDITFWESENPFMPDRRIPLGFSDYHTWPIRKIGLIPEKKDGEIVVSNVVMGPGLKLDPSFINPFYHYRIDTKYKMQRFNEKRVLWRDSASFFSFHKQDKFHPPRTFHRIGNLVADEILDASRNYRYMAFGMANNQAKVDFYSAEHLPLPVSYLQDEKNVDGLNMAVEAAENTRKKLYGALARMATLVLSPTADDEEGHKPDKKDVQNLMDHWAAERQYWAALEAPFFQLMRDLPTKGEEAINQWDIVLQKFARSAFDYAARMAGNDARALRASVRARGQLAGGLKKLFSEI